jgi:IS30 family transposase
MAGSLVECKSPQQTFYRRIATMDYSYSTTSFHVKGKHLSYEDRVLIQIRLKDHYSIRAIAREIDCSPSTVSKEIARGSVSLYDGHVTRYKASAGQEAYANSRKHCCRHYDFLSKSAFLEYVLKHFTEDGWSLDACVGRAVLNGEFTREQIVCTKTLYRYVDLGFFGIKNHNLPEKLKRKAKKHSFRINKKKLGRSIEERPREIESREEFGHWECDLVLGARARDDQVLLTLAERKSREFLMLPIAGKTSECVMKAIQHLQETYSERFSEIFKTITTDNGSEFANLSELEKMADTLVYYAHPYTSCDKGTVERHNGLIRRFIPKGKRIDDFTSQQISDVETWCNSLPRKLLGYRTPDEIFEEEIDRIYQVTA